MADMQAMRAYATIIAMMDNDNLKYARDDENLRIDLGFDTDDLEVKIKFEISLNMSAELRRTFKRLYPRIISHFTFAPAFFYTHFRCGSLTTPFQTSRHITARDGNSPIDG